jgi:pimeloyl-ACP methyl ester carboxylesterase
MPVVEGAGVELAFESTGDGPPVVLVHGMAADRASMAPAARDLAPHARVVTYDRRGYGDSGAPAPYERTSVAEQAEDLVALLHATGAEGAVAGAADFGALVVLDVLLRHPGALSAAVLVDVLALQLAPDAMEPLAAERRRLEEALREGGREAAVEAWLAARGVSAGDRSDRARRDAAAFFADYGGQATLPLTRRGLRGLTVPLVVLDGAEASAHVRAAGDAVAGLVPAARRGGAEDLAEAVAALATGAGRPAPAS